MSNEGPLAGVRVLDLSTMIAGPWAGAILADQGADVIKIEDPNRGDGMRYAGTRKGDISYPSFMANRGKRGVALDLRDPDCKAALLKLAETADVFLHNSRPGAMERLGLGYDDVRAVREDIIYCSISAFGDSGPMARAGAYDPIMQCFTGMAWMQGGKEEGEPDLIKGIVCDKVTALNATQAISAALFARAMGRGGQNIHISMLSATAAFNWVDSCSNEAFRSPDVTVRPSPAQGMKLTRFADGWASVTPSGDKLYVDMLRAFDVEGADDPALATFAERMRNPEPSRAATARWEAKVATMPVAEGIRTLEALGVPCAKAMTFTELAEHPHVVATGLFQEDEYPSVGLVRQARPPIRFSGTPASIKGPAPSIGEHTNVVLAEVGIDGSTLKGAKQAG